jgi:dipeptidyl aminopeptidase/acylaminoacyl peptidase
MYYSNSGPHWCSLWVRLFAKDPSAQRRISPVVFLLVLLSMTSPPGLAQTLQRAVNDGELILQDVPEIPASLVERLNQYQSMRSASFLDWDYGGQGLYILTRFGNVSQIHHLTEPGGRRQQITWLDDPVRQVVRRNRSDELSFTMDKNGTEYAQIYLFDPKTASTRMLTDGQSRNTLIRWSKNGKRMAFQSTRRDGRSNDIWMMDPDHPEQAELLVSASNGDWWAPADFSDDGKFLLVQRLIKVTDSRIYLLDLSSRELRLVAGTDEKPSANRATVFDRDSKGFYFISNQRGRAAELAWRSVEPGAENVYISAQTPWDVSKFTLSDDGRRGAFVTDEEGISRLYLLSAQTRRYSLVSNLPLGLIYKIKFHPDNRQLALTLNTAQSPSDVFVMRLGRSAIDAKSLSRWTFSEVGGLDTATFVEPKLVRYPTFDLVGEEPRKVPAFVYQPSGKGPHPVIIQVHGGPEAQHQPSFNNVLQMWVAELGAAVIAPNIRGSTGYDSNYLSLDNGFLREDAVKDIGALLDWIATQPELDQGRVAIYGGSYGGYIALASAVHFSDRLRAGVSVVGISNFVSFLENTEEYRRDLRRREYGDERDPEMRTFLQRISPLNNVGQINVPFLVVQGQNDPRVPAGESEQIVQALREGGQAVWFMNALNEGHGYKRKANRDVFQQATMLFLQHHLVD